MSDLIRDERRCDLCGDTGACFSLDRSMNPPPGASSGCFGCLKAGRFGFFHVTEVGYLDRDGLTNYDDEPPEPRRLLVVGPDGDAELRPGAAIPAPQPVVPPPSAVEELRRTPDFPTWNEVPWLVHCSDFMVYMGTWQPAQIRAAAATRSIPAEELLEAMAGTGATMPTDPLEGSWALTFHVFQCLACHTLRGSLTLTEASPGARTDMP